MSLTRRAPIYLCFWALCVGLATTTSVGDEGAGAFFDLPESPIAGGRVFMKKGCVNCHAIQEIGGTGGPDLGKVQAAWSFLDIAGVMWNHNPKMGEEFKRRKIARPKMSSDEMFQLIAFVYFLNYFGNPGDAAEGELIFLRKDCVKCHSVGIRGSSDGHPLDQFESHRSPAFISAALWNKNMEMTVAMKERGIPRPVYEANDIVDILAFIRREANKQESGGPVYIPPGNSRKGALIFRDKGCIHCHSIRGQGGELGPKLGSQKYGGILSQMAGAMWNHGADMWDFMSKEGIAFPKFTAEEISDIMTYLYFSSFVDPPGNPERGNELFIEKGCVSCHALSPDKNSVGLNILKMKLTSASEVIAAMWNHTPEMEEAAKASNIAWPQFKPGEMRDLVAFVKSYSEAGSAP